MAKAKRASSSAYRKKHRAAQSNPLLEQLETRHPAFVLSIVYVLSVLVRHLLNLATTNGPITYIDEGLYINLARGLAWDQALTYRAMPTTYVYLTYPIVLIPLMFLPASVNLYRAVQLYNAMLISSTVFPTYLLARRIGFDRQKSYFAVLFIVLMPDIALSGFLMSECLLYPLFMWLAYCGWRLINQEKPVLFGSICAILTALLYFTKPGYIVFGAVLLLYFLFLALRSRKPGSILQAALLIVLLAALLFGAYALYKNTLDSSSTLLTHYDKQIPTFSATNVLVALQAAFLHLITFALSGLGILLIFPSLGRRHYSGSQRVLLDITLLSILVTIIGTAIMVSLYEWRGTWMSDRVHLRYLMCYAPLLLLLLQSSALERMKLQRWENAILFVLAILFVYPGGYAGFTAASSIMDSAAIASLHVRKLGWPLAIITTFCIEGFLIFTIRSVKKHGWNPSIRRTVNQGLVIFMLLNTALFYGMRSDNQIKSHSDIDTEAQALAEMVADETPLMITTNLYNDFRGFQSDVHLHKPVQYVVSNNMLLDAIDTKGVYRSFTPVTQAPNTYNHPTIETTLLAFDASVAEYIEFDQSVQLEKTPAETYTVARIQPGEPWLKTAISGMYGTELVSSTTGSLIVYDQQLLDRGSVTLHICMSSLANSDTVIFTAGGQQYSIAVTAQPAWYTIELPVTQCAFWDISFTSNYGIYISTYYTE